jgi:hypothetical protein
LRQRSSLTPERLIPALIVTLRVFPGSNPAFPVAVASTRPYRRGMTASTAGTWNWRTAARAGILLTVLSPVGPALGLMAIILLRPTDGGAALLLVFGVPMALAALFARLTGYRAGGMLAYAGVTAASVFGWGLFLLSQMQFD